MSKKTSDKKNIRNFRLTEKRKELLKKIAEKPAFDEFIDEKTKELKFSEFLDFLLEKAEANPTMFFEDLDKKTNLLIKELIAKIDQLEKKIDVGNKNK